MKKYILISLLLTTINSFAQTDKMVTITHGSKQKSTLIYMRKDPQTNTVVYYDAVGRVATPNGDTFTIKVAPGVTYSPSAKKITIVKEFDDSNPNGYDRRTDPQIGIGYLLGNALGKR